MKLVKYWAVALFLAFVAMPAAAFDYSHPAVRAELADWITSMNGKVSEAQSDQIVRAVVKYSDDRGLDPLWVLSIIRAESNYNAKAGNSYGARGLMQVVPRWHRDKLKGRSPLGVAVNVEVGTQIMADCMVKGKGNKGKALSCYSGGVGKRYTGKIVSTHAELRGMMKALTALLDLKGVDKPVYADKGNGRLDSMDALVASVGMVAVGAVK